ncbi:SET domain-containing protein [Aureobasidium subglaciale]|nr:SET domain-containing protein [Aureobasidium subglaciale]
MALTSVPTPTGLYAQRRSPTAGIGVFAVAAIPSGTRILCEPPLFALPEHDDVIECYLTIKALPLDQQATFWSLAASIDPPGDTEWIGELREACDEDIGDGFDDLVKKYEDAYSRFETNRFTLRYPDGSPNKLGVFPNAARFNHSCTPNVYHRYNPNVDCLTIHALRDIHPGEEICTAYIDICHDTAERRRILAHWNFECACDACETQDPAREARRHKLEELLTTMQRRENKRSFEKWGTWDYAEALTLVEEVISLMMEDGLEETDTLGEAYELAAEYNLAMACREDAIKWAERDVEVELTSIDPVMKLRGIIERLRTGEHSSSSDSLRLIIMPLLNFYLLNLKDNIQPHTFIAHLQKADSIKVIVASKPRHFVVKTTAQDASILNKPWDLMLLLQGLNGQLPNAVTQHISSQFTLPVGIPSKLLSGYPEKNARLIKEAPSAGLTGSLDNPTMPDSSQKLELSPDMLKFMDQLLKEHDGPVTMLNLLKFKPNGKQSYYQYGQEFIKVAGKRGGDAKIVGNVIPADGAKSGWDEIAIVHYASIKHFCDMLAGEDYQAINEKFRLPALEDTLLVCTTEFGVMGSKAKL